MSTAPLIRMLQDRISEHCWTSEVRKSDMLSTLLELGALNYGNQGFAVMS
jgi:hypothetical protein